LGWNGIFNSQEGLGLEFGWNVLLRQLGKEGEELEEFLGYQPILGPV